MAWSQAARDAARRARQYGRRRHMRKTMGKLLLRRNTRAVYGESQLLASYRMKSRGTTKATRRPSLLRSGGRGLRNYGARFKQRTSRGTRWAVRYRAYERI
jgi:hypothetical protein